MTDSQNKKSLNKVYVNACKRRHRKYKIHMREKVFHEVSRYRNLFKSISRNEHLKVQYEAGESIVNISGEFGLENEKVKDNFFRIAQECLSAKKEILGLDFASAGKIWPSAITFLCSLAQWVEMDNKYDRKRRIYSTDAQDEKVNKYLNSCGFYNYVGRKGGRGFEESDTNDVLKIRREKDRKLVEEREVQIIELLKSNSLFSADQIELFDSMILTETFSNVLEHGIINKDDGWWMLAQVHKKHKFISLCIADNGIGFANTLNNGPQKNDIMRKNFDDGELIKFSFEENVSGACDATFRTKKTKDNRGARRGNGLKRIEETCKKLEIEFSIISHKGYCNVDKNGKVQHNSFNNIVFGGTMYSFKIPIDRSLEWKP